MRDYTGSQSDAPIDGHAIYAQRLFRDFALNLIRGLSGGGSGYRVCESFRHFLHHCNEHEVGLGPVIDASINEIHQYAFRRQLSGREEDERDIVECVLKVFAEMVAEDSAARGRKSKRSDALVSSIEEMIIESERRARSHGWSYIDRFKERVDQIEANKAR